jgi:hypothetical protein
MFELKSPKHPYLDRQEREKAQRPQAPITVQLSLLAELVRDALHDRDMMSAATAIDMMAKHFFWAKQTVEKVAFVWGANTVLLTFPCVQTALELMWQLGNRKTELERFYKRIIALDAHNVRFA